jgi:hypothetical protein
MNDKTKNQSGGYVFLLLVLLGCALTAFFFFRIYLSPAPVLVPEGLETSATSSQNRIEQMNAYKNDAKATAKLMEGNKEL